MRLRGERGVTATAATSQQSERCRMPLRQSKVPAPAVSCSCCPRVVVHIPGGPTLILEEARGSILTTMSVVAENGGARERLEILWMVSPPARGSCLPEQLSPSVFWLCFHILRITQFCRSRVSNPRPLFNVGRGGGGGGKGDSSAQLEYVLSALMDVPGLVS